MVHNNGNKTQNLVKFARTKRYTFIGEAYE